MSAPPAQAPGAAAPAAPAVQYAQLPSFKVAKHVNKRVDLPAEAYVDLTAYVSYSQCHHGHGPQLTMFSTVERSR
jgi:hypothetical protein